MPGGGLPILDEQIAVASSPLQPRGTAEFVEDSNHGRSARDGDGQEDTNFRYNSRVRAENNKDNRKCLADLSSILSSARKWGYKVPIIALSDLSLPRKMKARPRVYSASEMVLIVSAADEPLGTICFVLGSTGMRIREVLALRIEDLDFQRNLIQIRHSVFAGTLGTPKSEASTASLPMRSAWRCASRSSWLQSTIARMAKGFCSRIVEDARSLRTSCGKRNCAGCCCRWGFHLRASMRFGMVSLRR
jgi:hypothetical protein